MAAMAHWWCQHLVSALRCYQDRLPPPVSTRIWWRGTLARSDGPYRSIPAVFWFQWILCEWNETEMNMSYCATIGVWFIRGTYLCPLMRLAKVDNSCLLKRSCSSSTASTCSGFDKFGTCKTAVNADNISMSSNTCLSGFGLNKKWEYIINWSCRNTIDSAHTYLRLLVQRINSLRPFGGFFLSKTSNACNVKFEYRGPIGP